jgi:hypothetical protein
VQRRAPPLSAPQSATPFGAPLAPATCARAAAQGFDPADAARASASRSHRRHTSVDADTPTRLGIASIGVHARAPQGMGAPPGSVAAAFAPLCNGHSRAAVAGSLAGGLDGKAQSYAADARVTPEPDAPPAPHGAPGGYPQLGLSGPAYERAAAAAAADAVLARAARFLGASSSTPQSLAISAFVGAHRPSALPSQPPPPPLAGPFPPPPPAQPFSAGGGGVRLQRQHRLGAPSSAAPFTAAAVAGGSDDSAGAAGAAASLAPQPRPPALLGGGGGGGSLGSNQRVSSVQPPAPASARGSSPTGWLQLAPDICQCSAAAAAAAGGSCLGGGGRATLNAATERNQRVRAASSFGMGTLSRAAGMLSGAADADFASSDKLAESSDRVAAALTRGGGGVAGGGGGGGGARLGSGGARDSARRRALSADPARPAPAAQHANGEAASAFASQALSRARAAHNGEAASAFASQALSRARTAHNGGSGGGAQAQHSALSIAAAAVAAASAASAASAGRAAERPALHEPQPHAALASAGVPRRLGARAGARVEMRQAPLLIVHVHGALGDLFPTSFWAVPAALTLFVRPGAALGLRALAQRYQLCAVCHARAHYAPLALAHLQARGARFDAVFDLSELGCAAAGLPYVAAAADAAAGALGGGALGAAAVAEREAQRLAPFARAPDWAAAGLWPPSSALLNEARLAAHADHMDAVPLSLSAAQEAALSSHTPRKLDLPRVDYSPILRHFGTCPRARAHAAARASAGCRACPPGSACLSASAPCRAPRCPRVCSRLPGRSCPA